MAQLWRIADALQERVGDGDGGGQTDLAGRGDQREQDPAPLLALLQPDIVRDVGDHGADQSAEPGGDETVDKVRRNRGPDIARRQDQQAGHPQRIDRAGQHGGAVFADLGGQGAGRWRAEQTSQDIDAQQQVRLTRREQHLVAREEQKQRRRPAGAERQAQVRQQNARHAGVGDEL